MAMKKPPDYSMQRLALDRRLKPTHVRLLLILVTRGDAWGRCCRATNKTLAKDLKVSEAYVTQLLADLFKSGWIDIRYRLSLGGAGRLLDPRLEVARPVGRSSGGVQLQLEGGGGGTTPVGGGSTDVKDEEEDFEFPESIPISFAPRKRKVRR
jgi:hypothetical protein